MLNGTSDVERVIGSSAGLSPFVFGFTAPKSLPRICSALDMADSDQRAKSDEDACSSRGVMKVGRKKNKTVTDCDVLSTGDRPHSTPFLDAFLARRPYFAAMCA